MKLKIIHSQTAPKQMIPGNLWLASGYWPDLAYLEQIIRSRGVDRNYDFAPLVPGAFQYNDENFAPQVATGEWECSLGAALGRYCGGSEVSQHELHPALFWEHPPLILKPALFLDRDGILNTDHGYVSRYQDIEWVKGIGELIQLANKLGLYVFVITNQGGVAYGHYREADVLKLHQQMHDYLLAHGAFVDAWAYAPTHAEKGSARYKMESLKRKPYPGMMLELSQRFGVDLSNSMMVGDKPSDHLYLQGPEYVHLQGNYDLPSSSAPVFTTLREISQRLQEKFS